MSTSKGNFSRFVLKPSSLSQHTENFNKILEQVPMPHKLEKLDLINSSDSLNSREASKVDNKEQVNPKQEFVFGEKLSDRVITAEVIVAPEIKSDDSLATTSATLINQSNSTNKQNDNEDLNTNEDSNFNVNNDYNENDQESTLLKINCKLYLLDAKKTWLERGYGMLKVIETNDKTNCKIMMWTDKCFRLILNTKLFENMSIDKANKKAIRFSGYDNGNVKLFYVKTSNTNDCDELYDILKIRVEELQHKSSTKEKEDKFLFKCQCEISNEDTNEEEESISCELFVLENKKIDSRTSSFIINIKDDMNKTNIKQNLEEIELNKETHSFTVEENDKKIKVQLYNEEEFKKLFVLYEDKFSNNSDCSNNSDDYRAHKHKSKRGPVDDDESHENYESDENDQDHNIKKAKISKNTDSIH